MPTCTSHRLAARFLGSNTPTVVVAHVDPNGTPWGWTFPRLCRMHVIPLTVEVSGLVWLEDRSGHRSFDVESMSAAFDIETLRASVSQSRDGIESAWIQWCVARGWLDYSPNDAAISLYPGTAHEITRRLKEGTAVPELQQIDVTTNAASFEARLNRLIWLGADDGSDSTES